MSRNKNDRRRSKRNEEHRHAKQRLATTNLAERRNRFVASLTDEIIVAHASSGGRLEHFCRDLVTADKPIWRLADPTNADVVALGARAIHPADGGDLGRS